jgi:hypothetical protein
VNKQESHSLPAPTLDAPGSASVRGVENRAKLSDCPPVFGVLEEYAVERQGLARPYNLPTAPLICAVEHHRPWSAHNPDVIAESVKRLKIPAG